tara:strand:+ start:56 stop:1207 length:1152 start_codon:yes stop_codon:yes gene_type:complete
MSQLKVNAIRSANGTGDAITLAAASNTATANLTQINSIPFPGDGNISHRNLMHNGAMQIAQRPELTTSDAGYGSVDRWYFYNEGDGRATITQSTDVPSTKEFKYSYKLDVTTADTAGAGSRGHVGQWLEARDSGVTLKGTSAAKQITVQFWVKSPKTGTHIVALSDNGATDHSSSRFINATYTVSTANTWEKKTVTFAGDTTGVFNTTTGRGFHVGFRLVQGSNSTSGALATSWADYALANEGAGQVNVLDNTSNDFYLTGVQVEIGDQATDFEHLSYQDDLLKCQRYYQKIDFYKYTGSTTTYSYWCDTVQLRPSMRATPTLLKTTDINVDTGTGSFKISNGTVATDGAVIDRASTECVIFKQKDGYNWSWNTIRMHFISEL